MIYGRYCVCMRIGHHLILMAAVATAISRKTISWLLNESAGAQVKSARLKNKCRLNLIVNIFIHHFYGVHGDGDGHLCKCNTPARCALAPFTKNFLVLYYIIIRHMASDDHRAIVFPVVHAGSPALDIAFCSERRRWLRLAYFALQKHRNNILQFITYWQFRIIYSIA